MNIIYLERGKTIDHESYIDCCFKPIFDILNRPRLATGWKNIKFHHDNSIFIYASWSLKSRRIPKWLRFTKMDHQPYSPDSALSDFGRNKNIKACLDEDKVLILKLPRSLIQEAKKTGFGPSQMDWELGKMHKK